MKKLTRRGFVANLTGLAMASMAPAALASLIQTPRQSAGPFYPETLPLDDDNDLTRVEGFHRPALGTITDLSGRVLDINGKPLPSVRVEIWQCDANTRYRHSRDHSRKPVDAGFQGHGSTLSAANGSYRFRTIRPVAYPGRTPHIHVAVFAKGEQPFVTQLYIQDEPRNAEDFLFNNIRPELRQLVSVPFSNHSDDLNHQLAHWDIILGLRGV
jgi:protocatechuate 3,4-dioxygenase beta subunit